ncbi:O-antigen ligase family protein [Candidatus Saccharibacteria bacterium]|nr:O-antigen ligase family protein [Candidatus Saccharibacteria bacterium]
MSTLVQIFEQYAPQVRITLLGLLLFLLPFELYPHVELHSVAVRMSQVVGVLLILFCVQLIWQKRADWIKLPWVLLAVFVLVSALSAVFAISKTKGLMVSSYYAFDFILAYAVAQTFAARDSELYKKIIYVSGIVVAVFCVYQFIGDTLGVSNNLTLLNVRYTKLVFGFARVSGFSLEPLYLANYLFIPLCLALVSYIFTNKRNALVLSLVFMSVMWLTVARGAYVSLFAVLCGAGALTMYRRQWRTLIHILLIVIGSMTLAFGMIRLSGSFARQLPKNEAVPTNLQTTIPQQGIDANGNTERLLQHTTDFTGETSVQDRKQSSQIALQLFKTKPLLGVGPGNFGRYVVKQYPAVFTDPNQIANNETFELLAEVGLVGFIVFASFIVWLVWQAVQYSVKRNSKPTNIWFFATSFMLVAFAIQWQTFSTLYVTHIWVMAGLFIGVITYAKHKPAIKKN